MRIEETDIPPRSFCCVYNFLHLPRPRSFMPAFASRSRPSERNDETRGIIMGGNFAKILRGTSLRSKIAKLSSLKYCEAIACENTSHTILDHFARDRRDRSAARDFSRALRDSQMCCWNVEIYLVAIEFRESAKNCCSHAVGWTFIKLAALGFIFR